MNIMMNSIGIYHCYKNLKISLPMSFKFYCQTWVKRKAVRSFNRPTREKAPMFHWYWGSTNERPFVFLLSRLNWPSSGNLISGHDHQTQIPTLPLRVWRGGAVFLIYADFSISSLLDYFGALHFRPSSFFL